MRRLGRRGYAGVRYRRFGNTELTVSEVGFGCARIGGVFQRSSKKDQVGLLRQAFAAGITVYDTADMYAQGDSERLLGDAFRKDRQRIIITSKVGYCFPARPGFASSITPIVKKVAHGLGVTRQRLPRRMLSTVSDQDFS